ncbi:hypothetical protein L195_g038910, partial [Trifolium pratense]
MGGEKPVKENGAAVKTNRLVTRSICAQLLANAQVATFNENNKKQACANVAPKPVPTADDGVRTWAYLHFVGIVTNER